MQWRRKAKNHDLTRSDPVMDRASNLHSARFSCVAVFDEFGLITGRLGVARERIEPSTRGFSVVLSTWHYESLTALCEWITAFRQIRFQSGYR